MSQRTYWINPVEKTDKNVKFSYKIDAKLN